MTTFLRYFAPIYKVLDAIRNILIVLIFGFIILSGTWAIFLRYMPDLKTLPWIDEVLRYLNIWLVFLGASVAVKQGSHLSVDFFIRKMFPERIVKIIKKCALGIMLICLLILIMAGTQRFFKSLNVVIQAAPISIAVFYLAVPVGCLLLLLDYALILIYGEHPFALHHADEAHHQADEIEE
jgi:TRAP-type C4-dicarboxylate transport system permease small subunit